ncbi:hypothetical protein ACWEQC_06860 [Streptomyces shenzhenensis]
MAMPFWRRRNQEPEPVRPQFQGLARGTSGDASSIGDPVGILSTALTEAQEEAARWKRHADSYEQDRERALAALTDRIRERDGAYRERAQLLAWLAALHPSTAVITPAADVTDEDGWHLLYLVAGGWQMSWHIAPHDVPLFKHVTAVDTADPRVQWDGHGTEQKYERLRNHVRLLVLDGLADDASSTAVSGPEVRSA